MGEGFVKKSAKPLKLWDNITTLGLYGRLPEQWSVIIVMMMLEQFTVENFKAFKHLELKDLGHINIFVGENNVGKTCLLQAIGLSLLLSNPFFLNFKLLDSPKYVGFLFYFLQPSVSDSFYKHHFSKYIELSQKLFGIEEIESASISYDAEWETFNLHNRLKEPITNIHYSPSYPPFDANAREHRLFPLVAFMPTTTNYVNLAKENFVHFVDNLKQEQEIISVIQKVTEKKLTSIRYSTNSELKIGLNGMEKLLPLASMGDGFTKLLGLTTVLKQKDLSMFCIDEPENGFHYKTQTSFWKLLANWSLEGDKQSFIATHSYELIRNLNDLLTADPTLLERGLKVRVHRLKRDEEDMEKIHVVTIAEEGIAALLEMNLELR